MELFGKAAHILVAVHQRVFGCDVCQLVALAVELTPQDVLELGQSLAGDGRDEHHGEVVGQSLAQHVDKLVVEQVALGDRQHAVLVEHLGVELLQFLEQHFIFALDIDGVAGHHEEQQRVAFDVAEKAQSQSLALAGSLDDAGDVGHDKRLVVMIVYDAQ